MIKRRTLLKNAALGMGALVSLPTWAKGWNTTTIPQSSKLNQITSQILADIVGTIIPETDTPGAKSLGVHHLIQAIVADCYGKQAFAKLEANVQAINTLARSKYGGEFETISADNRLALLNDALANDTNGLKSAVMQLKQLTIMGYMNSEYVMTNITNFEWAPARYKGCVQL